MIKTTEDIIYNNLKTNVGFHRSKKFKKWFHKEYPGMIMHHVFGSYSQRLKTSDYCSIPLTVGDHEIAERDKSTIAIEGLGLMLKVMQKYIIYLEKK